MSMSLKVMVVDDSLTYRSILKRLVENLAGVELIATASNGKIALAKIAECQPDLVLLDVTMPEMDGLTALKRIRAEFPGVQVVMVSGLSRDNADIVMQCLSSGAMEFVTKPIASQGMASASEALRKELLPILNIVVAKLLVRRNKQPIPASRSRPAQITKPTRPASGTAQPVARAPARALRKPDLLLIGSSTGGPVALAQVLKGMGPGMRVPILIVQHMPPVFTASLAAQLERSSGTSVKEAEEGDELVPGNVLLAPGGRHMTFENTAGKPVVALNDSPRVNGCRPAVDVLFGSVAERFPGRVLSLVLTGMGQDGANGVEALKRQNGGCACIVQDEASCVVYGMPRAVNERGLADEVLPLEAIGDRIRQLCA